MSLSDKIKYKVSVDLIGTAALKAQRFKDERKWEVRSKNSDSSLASPLRSTIEMKELMGHHYLAGHFAEGAKKVAWVTSGAPIEILRALDFHLVYPENHAALCGARKQTVELSTQAEYAGYSQDLCSYARTDIGSALSGKTPVGKLPKPDLLLCCTNICQTVLYWYRVLADHFKVPLYVIDAPFLYGEAEEHQLDFVKEQLEGLIPVAEKVAGKKLSYKKLQRVMQLSKDASELWLEILNRNQHHPAPMTAFDTFIVMAPIVDLRGSQSSVEFYRKLLRELDERIANGVGAVKDEQYRVLWDNLPIWPRIRPMSQFLAERGVNVIAATYTYAWGELAPMMDVLRPLESAARVYLHPILNRSAAHKLSTMKSMIQDFKMDGVILHSDRSCKPYSLGQMGQRDALVNGLGVPSLLLEADHSDPRSFSDEGLFGRIEAFIETMELQ